MYSSETTTKQCTFRTTKGFGSHQIFAGVEHASWMTSIVLIFLQRTSTLPVRRLARYTDSRCTGFVAAAFRASSFTSSYRVHGKISLVKLRYFASRQSSYTVNRDAGRGRSYGHVRSSSCNDVYRCLAKRKSQVEIPVFRWSALAPFFEGSESESFSTKVIFRV